MELLSVIKSNMEKCCKKNFCCLYLTPAQVMAPNFQQRGEGYQKRGVGSLGKEAVVGTQFILLCGRRREESACWSYLYAVVSHKVCVSKLILIRS